MHTRYLITLICYTLSRVKPKKKNILSVDPFTNFQQKKYSNKNILKSGANRTFHKGPKLYCALMLFMCWSPSCKIVFSLHFTYYIPTSIERKRQCRSIFWSHLWWLRLPGFQSQRSRKAPGYSSVDKSRLDSNLPKNTYRFFAIRLK